MNMDINSSKFDDRKPDEHLVSLEGNNCNKGLLVTQDLRMGMLNKYGKARMYRLMARVTKVMWVGNPSIRLTGYKLISSTDDEGPGGAVHQMTGSHSRLRQYEGVERSVLKWAGHTYTAIMATQGMYKTDLGTLGKHQLEVWKIGCAKYEVDPKMLPIGIGHIKNMSEEERPLDS
ncbi:hypothetical protein FRC11_003008 [Ceratobasidium sp. 423]|nr:hypothetical protein FRC11_003008 [Ceratobasidium sp. 423]